LHQFRRFIAPFHRLAPCQCENRRYQQNGETEKYAMLLFHGYLLAVFPAVKIFMFTAQAGNTFVRVLLIPYGISARAIME
jgi:hypothetical protein